MSDGTGDFVFEFGDGSAIVADTVDQAIRKLNKALEKAPDDNFANLKSFAKVWSKEVWFARVRKE